MPALALILATGPRRGDVVSVIPWDQHPGARVAENAAGRWAFVYLTDAEPEEVPDLTEALETDYEGARESVPVAERIKNDIVDKRASYIDLDSLPAVSQRDWATYAEFNSPTAYRITEATLRARAVSRGGGVSAQAGSRRA